MTPNVVSFNANGSHLATTGYDGQVRVWDTATGQMTSTWAAHDGWAFGVEYSPTGNQLATCGRRGAITLWSLQGIRQRDLQADDDVACATFSPDGSQLAACTANGQLQIFSVADADAPGIHLLR